MTVATTALLPIRPSEGTIQVVDVDTGEMYAVSDAPVEVLAAVGARLDEITAAARSARATVADELLRRMGRSKLLTVGAYAGEATTRRDWDPDATWAALSDLVDRGLITPAEADEAMPEKTARRPDGRRLNALLTQLAGEDPVAAQALAQARSAKTSLKIVRTAVDGTAEAAT